MLEKHKSGHLVTRETFVRKPLEITTSLKILRQDFGTIKGWAVSFMCHSVSPLSENYISFEVSHRLPAKVNGLPAPFNFLILSFRRVSYVVRFLLGISPASEC